MATFFGNASKLRRIPMGKSRTENTVKRYYKDTMSLAFL